MGGYYKFYVGAAGLPLFHKKIEPKNCRETPIIFVRDENALGS